MYGFIYSSCLIVLDRNSSPILNRNYNSGHPCLIPDLRGNISFFKFLQMSIMLAVCFTCIALLCWSKILLLVYCGFLLWKGTEFSLCFFCTYWMICDFSLLFFQWEGAKLSIMALLWLVSCFSGVKEPLNLFPNFSQRELV